MDRERKKRNTECEVKREQEIVRAESRRTYGQKKKEIQEQIKKEICSTSFAFPQM